MENMVLFRKEFFLSLIAFAVLWLSLFFIKIAIKKFSYAKKIDANRRKVIFILLYLIVYMLLAAVFAIIWGVGIERLAIFASSILAVLGIGFFAQWSLLSNITASAILFFSHPVRIGSRIRILDSDYDFVGEVTDITSFYFFMKTNKGQILTFPNNLITQKGIEIIEI